MRWVAILEAKSGRLTGEEMLSTERVAKGDTGIGTQFAEGKCEWVKR